MKKLQIIIGVFLAIGMAGCKKGFLDQDDNPNAPSTTTIQFTLSGTEKAAADIPNGWGSSTNTIEMYAHYACWIGYWAPQYGFIPQPDIALYQITTSTLGFPWTDLYNNLSNVSQLQTAGAATPANANYEAIAKVLWAYDFQQVVDNYGDAPYTQAFQSPKVLFPAYDKGAAIYADLLVQLDAAIDLINKNPTAASPGSADIIFQGNMANWIKFANSLKLRIIMRQSKLPIFSSLKAEMATTISGGFLDGTTEADAQPGYLLSDSYGGQESPFWLIYGTTSTGASQSGNSFYAANSYAVNMLKGYNDPRVTRYYATLDGSDNPAEVVPSYLGNPNPPNPTSKIGPGLLKSASMPAVMFSGSESLFLQAEAVNDGVIPGNSLALYQSAITASFEAVGLTAAQASAYYTQPASATGNIDITTATEQNIITQKYIALNGYGVFEAYNEYRRTGYPLNIPLSTTATGVTNIPTRIYYPQIEFDTNSSNVGAEPVVNIFTSKIFWDQN